jgi:hypothetical protein
MQNFGKSKRGCGMNKKRLTDNEFIKYCKEKVLINSKTWENLGVQIGFAMDELLKRFEIKIEKYNRLAQVSHELSEYLELVPHRVYQIIANDKKGKLIASFAEEYDAEEFLEKMGDEYQMESFYRASL